MISDEPDEDADEIDDETMLEAYLGPAQASGNGIIVDLPDWPMAQGNGQGTGLNLDMATVAWFKATYVEWQREIESVLRGWIVAHTRTDPMRTGQDMQPLGG